MGRWVSGWVGGWVGGYMVGSYRQFQHYCADTNTAAISCNWSTHFPSPHFPTVSSSNDVFRCFTKLIIRIHTYQYFLAISVKSAACIRAYVKMNPKSNHSLWAWLCHVPANEFVDGTLGILFHRGDSNALEGASNFRGCVTGSIIVMFTTRHCLCLS